MGFSMIDSAMMNLVLEFIYKLIALFILWFMLRMLERFNGRTWNDTLEIIEGDALALSIYRSAMWIGCALVLAF